MSVKVCGKCKSEKRLDEFGVLNRSKDGRNSVCKLCVSKRPSKHKSVVTTGTRALRLGLSSPIIKSIVDDLVVEQDGACAICLMDSPDPWSMDLDHCHTTGKIRGLLCSNCNRGLGLFGDNPDVLGRATEYLRRHSLESLSRS